MKQDALPALILFIVALATVTACAGRQPSAVSRQSSSDQSPTPSSQLPAEALEKKRLLATADAPERDLVDLTIRLTDAESPVPRTTRNEPWGFALGDSHDFWVQIKGSGDYHQVPAGLLYETPHVYWFVEQGLEFDARSLHNVAERFESEIYPTNHYIFGWEWSPGVDNDPHLVILLASDLGGGVSAYQNNLDEYTRAVFPFSNEMELITASVEADQVDDPAFACTLAHEFQHVIQWAVDRDETTWLNEVFSLLACPLNGLQAEYADFILKAFAEESDVQLNAWSVDQDQVASQYGASQLFGAYFLERFGKEAVQALAANPGNGLRGVDQTVQVLDAGPDGDAFFADWVAANYLDDPSSPDGGLEGRFGYRSLDLPSITPFLAVDANSTPVEEKATVGQYAADYIALNGPGEFQIDFAGATLVRPAPAAHHSGDYLWWGGREQESDATLSRESDLTGLNEATLTFYAWYDIDQGFDYAYVTASTDGQRWSTLPGQKTVDSRSKALSFGHGYTSQSDGWIQEQIDLTPYAGEKVQIRFEYVTDDGPLRPGFLLDDIEIPELGYRHDAESGDGGWAADGFLRQANLLPQEWLVQLLRPEGEPAVEQLQLNPDNSGRWTVTLGPDETATLAISGLTRDTAEPADYWFRISVSG